MSKWQMWTIVFHMIAVQEGLDCVEIKNGNEESKAEERKEQMVVKTSFPNNWANANTVNASITYVHAADTTRFFVLTFQERQGNKIEAEIKKQKKVPTLSEPAVPTIKKFIQMQEDDFLPS